MAACNRLDGFLLSSLFIRSTVIVVLAYARAFSFKHLQE